MGRQATENFLRLYVTPGADHVGTGAPVDVDMLEVLVGWVDGVARVNIDGNPVYLLGVAREALPASASILAGYPGKTLAFPNTSARPAAEYVLFRDGSRLSMGPGGSGPPGGNRRPAGS